MENERAVMRSLEAQYRHDLALHLYSVVLLHHRDPAFPAPHWARWPAPARYNPRDRGAYEDLPFAELGAHHARKRTEYLRRAGVAHARPQRIRFFSHNRQIQVQRTLKHSPQAVLLNEIYAAVVRSARRKYRKKYGSDFLEVDSMALKTQCVGIANRLSRTLNYMRVPRPKYSWHDVLIGCLVHTPFKPFEWRDIPPVWDKCSRLFVEIPLQYGPSGECESDREVREYKEALFFEMLETCRKQDQLWGDGEYKVDGEHSEMREHLLRYKSVRHHMEDVVHSF